MEERYKLDESWVLVESLHAEEITCKDSGQEARFLNRKGMWGEEGRPATIWETRCAIILLTVLTQPLVLNSSFFTPINSIKRIKKFFLMEDQWCL